MDNHLLTKALNHAKEVCRLLDEAYAKHLLATAQEHK